MRQYVPIGVLANWISMIRAGTKGAIWLPDDDHEARFYERCAHQCARVVPAGGVAVKLLGIVRERGVRGVVAMVRKPGTVTSIQEGVFRPGLGDVASLLLLSTAYEQVIRDVAGVDWLTACSELVGDLRLRAVSIARAFRRARARHREVTFHQLVVTVDRDIFRLRDNELRKLCGGWLPDGSEEKWDDPRDPAFRAALHECDGMDVLEVLSHAIETCTPHGIRAMRYVSPLELMSLLRVAFDLKELESDELFWEMRSWERRNGRYPLLCAWRSLDPLGAVLDQRYWENDLGVMLSRLVNGEVMGIAKVDMDNFKCVNEALGHSGGDDAIRRCCGIVKGVFGAVGEVYRRGGDEVLALVPVLEQGELERLCEAARSENEEGFRVWCIERGMRSQITVSIGAVVVRYGAELSEVVKRLDRAQLEAKRSGKNRVVVDYVG